MSSWQIVLLEPARTMLGQIGSFINSVLLVVIILVIGWLASKLVKSLVTKSLRFIKLDELSDRIELDNMLAKGGIKYSLSELLGVICYWLVLLITVVVALNSVNLMTAALLDKVVALVPKTIIAVFIFILGMFVATVMKNIVMTASSNAGLTYSAFLAKATQFIVMMFALLMVLEELNIGVRISEITLSIVLGSIGLAFALAFGLGCKDIAGKMISNFIEKLNK